MSIAEAPSEQPDEAPGVLSRRRVLAALGWGGGALVLGACEFGSGDDEDDEAATDDPQPEEPDTEVDEQEEAAEAEGEENGEDFVDKDPDEFIIHGTEPQTFETPRPNFGTSALTATSLMFVRNNLPAPSEEELGLDDRDAWSLEVEGVQDAGEITLGELKKLGVQEVAMVLQCSGNGRAFFEHDPSGSPWAVGASGNVMWTGVPVSAVAEAMGGVVNEAQFVTGTGGEEIPEGLDERDTVVERSIPLEKGLDDCLLAWEMNGEPLPRAHGAPLRLIVPGYFGVNNVKYIKRLAFTEEESDASIQTSGYRVRDIGEGGETDQPTMWDMNVKSFVTLPAEDEPVQAGTVQIFGVAWSGGPVVERVEVSIDGGESWEDAEFYGPDLGPYAWRRWVHTVEAEEGQDLQLTSRATDAEGETQPEERIENERGYLHNGWRDHTITVEVQA